MFFPPDEALEILSSTKQDLNLTSFSLKQVLEELKDILIDMPERREQAEAVLDALKGAVSRIGSSVGRLSSFSNALSDFIAEEKNTSI